MNVNDFLPDIEEKPVTTMTQLMWMRKEAFLGFDAIEAQNGMGLTTHPIESKQGQAAFRSLFARVVEEMLEAIDSEEDMHFQEEWIDALNFGLGMLFIPRTFGGDMWASFLSWLEFDKNDKELLDLIEVAKEEGIHMAMTAFTEVTLAFNPALQRLRNRSWQNNTQVPYYDAIDLFIALRELLYQTIAICGGWYPFVRLYTAKHRVLLFRLETNY